MTSVNNAMDLDEQSARVIRDRAIEAFDALNDLVDEEPRAIREALPG